MASKPNIPDYATLNQQGADLSKQGAIDRANLNRYGQTTAEGSTGQFVTNPDTGATNFTTTMGAQPKALYDALTGGMGSNYSSFQDRYWGDGAGGGAAAGGGGVNVNIPAAGGGGASPVGQGIQSDLDYSKLTGMPTTDPGAARQQAQDALYNMNTQYLDPQFKQSQQSLETKLANQGLVPGTEAYNRAAANEAQAKEQAYRAARESSIAGGGLEQERAQKLALELRNQGITEAGNLGTFHNAAQDQGAKQWLTKYGYDTGLEGQLGAASINAGASMSNAALANQLGTRQQQWKEIMDSGTSANSFLPKISPPSGSSVGEYATADPEAAAKDTYNSELDAYNAKKAKKGGVLGTIGTVAGAVIGGVATSGNPAGIAAGAKAGGSLGALSDARLKTNVERVGQTPGGHNVYDYDIRGRRERGVMAQEVKKFLPEAVSKGKDGYLRVDYSKVT